MIKTYITKHPPNVSREKLEDSWKTISRKKQFITTPPKSGLRVATYNTKGFCDVDGRPRRKDQFAVIQKLNADVVCLQECYRVEDVPFSYKDFGSIYPYYCAVNAHYGLGNIIFSRFPIIEGETVQLPGKGEGRGAVRIKICVGNRLVNIWCSHLDVFDNTGQMRYLGILEVLKRINMKNNPQEMHIWCGDFNSLDPHIYSPNEWAWIRQNHLHRGINPVPTNEIQTIKNFGFKNVFSLKNQFPPKMTCWSGTTVDYIFCLNIHPNQIQRCETMVSEASDHYPIISDFWF